MTSTGISCQYHYKKQTEFLALRKSRPSDPKSIKRWENIPVFWETGAS